MKCIISISALSLVLFCTSDGHSQILKEKPRPLPPLSDSVVVDATQKTLFITPKRNILITHFDMEVGASRVVRRDNSGLGISASAKGLYMVSGALYVNMGLGITSLRSRSREEIIPDPGPNKATVISLPFGVGFTMGDDRAMIINGIDLFPVYYVDNPTVKNQRTFTWGAGMDLGFHIRIRERLHLGMMGKVQFFMPYDKDEPGNLPRYGFAGAGVIFRYD
jgi:hypothetical protein